MKISLSSKNIKNIPVNIKVFLSLNDIATHLVSNLFPLKEEEIIKQTKKLGKRAIIQHVQDSILYDGLETPHYKISDNKLDHVVEQISEIIEKKF